MRIKEEIKKYITNLPEPKRSEMQKLHGIIQCVMPKSKLWFLDGKNEEGKTVSNPNIGYGINTIKYTDGKTKEFYQIGLSANTAGISVYILGIKDKTYLAKTFGKKLGKASVTGYCIKFKTIKDINVDVLEAAIRYGIKAEPTQPHTQKNTNTKSVLKFCKMGHQFYKSSYCPTCPVCEKERKPKDGFLSLISAPARRALERENINTLKELSKWTEKNLLKLHGIGPSSIPVIRKALKENRLDFRK